MRVSKRKLQGHDDQQRERDAKEQEGERQPGRQERAVVLKEFDERPCQDTPKGLKDRHVLSRHGPLRMAQERRTVNLSAYAPEETPRWVPPFGAGGGDRTRTPLSGHGILSPG